jgi:hypothetical protein
MQDINFQKRGLQLLCRLVEDNVPILLHRVSDELFQLKNSSCPRVRLWHYKCIAAMKARSFLEYVVYQLYFGETDAENLTWACAALCAIAPPQVLSQWTNDRKVEVGGPFGLASLLYGHQQIGNQLIQELPIHLEDNPLMAKWFCMLFGYERPVVGEGVGWSSLDLIRDLNSHPHQEVMEYSVWALWRSSATSLINSTITKDQIAVKPPNVRRWLYQLASKGAPVKMLDQVVQMGQSEPDMLAREGAALALHSAFSKDLAHSVVDWFYFERSLLVKVALVRHLARYRRRSALYRDVLMDLLQQMRAGNEDATALLRAGATEAQLLIDDLSRLANDHWMVQPLLQFTGPINLVENHTTSGNISIQSVNQNEKQTPKR